VSFRSLAVLLTLLVLAGGCTPSDLPQTTAAASPQATLPREVEQVVGPVYRSPELESLVSRVGQRLVSVRRTGRSSRSTLYRRSNVGGSDQMDRDTSPVQSWIDPRLSRTCIDTRFAIGTVALL